ncbi:CHAT domain-containing protein [Sorangium sp. So ce385]|uniref:CHAT domain-containing protein n=1 Tax=Sorangium sp. So ce385 TaxID=3133308 RepID=UPI003F5C2DB9
MDAALEVAAGGPARALGGTAVNGGVLARVEVAGAADAVTVTATLGAAAASFRLAVATSTAVPALEEAEELRQAGRFDEATARLAALLEDERPDVRAQAERKLARVVRVRGEPARAAELLAAAIVRDRAEGRVSDEFQDRFLLTFIRLYVDRQLGEARQGLDALAPLAVGYPEGAAVAPYFRGLVAVEGGDLRAALGLFREAAERTVQLGVEDFQQQALQQWSVALGILGRHAEAVALMREAEARLPVGANPCQRARLLNNAGWLALRAADVRAHMDNDGGEAALPDPTPMLEEALHLSRVPCSEPVDRANLLVNLAYAALDRGHAEEARRRLDDARRENPSPSPLVEVWRLLLEGRIAIAEHRPAQALAWFDQVEDRGERGAFLEARFEGALRRAEALDMLGRAAAARAAFAEVEVLLEAWSRAVPLGEGRDTFLGRHEQAARLHVDFLVRQARRDPTAAEEAARVARKSRARLLADLDWTNRIGALSPEARARWEAAVAEYRRARAALDEAMASDWRLTQDRREATAAERTAEHARLRVALDAALALAGQSMAPAIAAADLPRPGDGELQLVYHPVRHGWVGFAVTASGVAARPLGEVDPGAAPDRLADQMFGPFHADIVRAGRLRIAAYGALDRLDLHALPWEGRPLVAHAPVVYGLDLPARTAAPASAECAVVVGDPGGDLPAARAEARAVAFLLERRGLRVALLEGPAATHDAVRGAIEQPEVAILHYAGHGVFEGRDGWESALPLAAGGRLTVGDILALAHAPARVVLSGCETARTADAARAGGLGLAQAFAAAGAGVVVATARPVDDALAARVIGALYAGDAADTQPRSSEGFLDDIPASLRAVQLALHDTRPGVDWASFRTLVR